jgi:hypothetical protein
VQFDDLELEQGLQRLLQLAALSYAFLHSPDPEAAGGTRLRGVYILTQGAAAPANVGQSAARVRQETRRQARDAGEGRKHLLHSLQQGQTTGEEIPEEVQKILARLTGDLPQQEPADTETPGILKELLEAVENQEKFPVLQKFLDILQPK